MTTGQSAGPVTFYTISSGLYFPGFVGLVNSLRLAGHEEPVVVLERGMSRGQKKVLEGCCTLVSMEHQVRNPCHLTAYPSKLGPKGIVVLIDSDALVLERLDHAIGKAREGKICMFGDPERDRSFPEWTEIFGLNAPLRRQPYYNTGFVVFSADFWPHLLERWWEVLRRVWDRPSFMEGASLVEDPVSQPDQDALNALLMSELPEESVHELPASENVFEPALPHVVIGDLNEMACTNAGQIVRLIQASGSPKPWVWQAVLSRRRTRCYLHLLRRALAGEDLQIRVPPKLLAPWLRPGRAGDFAYAAMKAWFRAPGPRRALRYLSRRLGA